jgi:hypothetical protein
VRISSSFFRTFVFESGALLLAKHLYFIGLRHNVQGLKPNIEKNTNPVAPQLKSG